MQRINLAINDCAQLTFWQKFSTRRTACNLISAISGSSAFLWCMRIEYAGDTGSVYDRDGRSLFHAVDAWWTKLTSNWKFIYTCIACCNFKHFATRGDPFAFHCRCRCLSSWTSVWFVYWAFAGAILSSRLEGDGPDYPVGIVAHGQWYLWYDWFLSQPGCV